MAVLLLVLALLGLLARDLVFAGLITPRLGIPRADSLRPPPPPALPRPAALCTPCGIRSILPGRHKLGGATLLLERVDNVTGGSYGEGASNVAHPQNATHLPELCALIVRVVNATESPAADFRFGLFLPAAGSWNGRFLAVGNNAFSGGINWPQMGQGPHYGFATVSTDTGHSSPQAGQLQWALDRPDDVLEWGYRAVRGSVAAAKAIVEAYYPPRRGGGRMRSYFAGCSTGGRQALKAVQLDPDSFDGVLVGAPAWDTKHLMPWITKIGRDNLRADGSLIFDPLNPAQWLPFAAQVVSQCDAVDGVRDRIVSSPESCDLDFSRFTCPPGFPPVGCLTAEQVEAVKRVYADYYIADPGSGRRLVHGGMELGSELTWAAYLGGTSPAGFDTEYERFFLYNDTAWSWRQYSDAVVLDSERVDPGRATADAHADLARFRDRGGKVLMYQGLADGVVPPRQTTLFYNRTREALGGRGEDVDGFFRHFLVPGMQHCLFTPPAVNAPWMFAGAGQATGLQLLDPLLTTEDMRQGWGTPGFRGDPDYDVLLRLVRWVEDGEAPDWFNAVAYNADWTVNRTRKICPYPRKAVWTGVGQDEARNWFCA